MRLQIGQVVRDRQITATEGPLAKLYRGCSGAGATDAAKGARCQPAERRQARCPWRAPLVFNVAAPRVSSAQGILTSTTRLAGPCARISSFARPSDGITQPTWPARGIRGWPWRPCSYCCGRQSCSGCCAQKKRGSRSSPA